MPWSACVLAECGCVIIVYKRNHPFFCYILNYKEHLSKGGGIIKQYLRTKFTQVVFTKGISERSAKI